MKNTIGPLRDFSECDKATTICTNNVGLKYECTCKDGFEKDFNKEYACKQILPKFSNQISNQVSNVGKKCYRLTFNPDCRENWGLEHENNLKVLQSLLKL